MTEKSAAKAAAKSGMTVRGLATGAKEVARDIHLYVRYLSEKSISVRVALIPFLLTAMVIFSFALARATSEAVDNDKSEASVEQQLKDIDRKWLQASSDNNTDYLRDLFAERMFEVQPTGHVVSGKEMLQSIVRKGKDEGAVDDIQVRGLYGSTALLTDRRTIKGGANASSRAYPDGPYRVMRVYVKLNGRWRAVGAAMSPLTSPK